MRCIEMKSKLLGVVLTSLLCTVPLPAAAQPDKSSAEPLWTPNSSDEAVEEKIADKLNAAQKMFYDAMMARDDTVRMRRLQDASDIVLRLYETPANRPLLAPLLQNIGQMYQLNHMPAKSIEWWQRLARVEPENWRAWSKIVQCAQSLDYQKERDEAREKVFELNKAGKVDQKLYCREQFTVGDEYVMAMEYFVPDGRFGVEYSFLVSRSDAPERLNRRYTFGELKSDTLVARSVKAIGPVDKMYSIDGFDMHGQWLLSMTEKHLPYEQIRDMIIADLKKKPITLAPPEKKP